MIFVELVSQFLCSIIWSSLFVCLFVVLTVYKIQSRNVWNIFKIYYIGEFFATSSLVIIIIAAVVIIIIYYYFSHVTHLHTHCQVAMLDEGELEEEILT